MANNKSEKIDAVLGLSMQVPTDNSINVCNDVRTAADTDNSTYLDNDNSATLDKCVSTTVSNDTRPTSRKEKRTSSLSKATRSRVVESGGIQRSPRTVPIRTEYWRKIRLKAVRMELDTWEIIDEALGEYLNKGKGD